MKIALTLDKEIDEDTIASSCRGKTEGCTSEWCQL